MPPRLIAWPDKIWFTQSPIKPPWIPPLRRGCYLRHRKSALIVPHEGAGGCSSTDHSGGKRAARRLGQCPLSP